MSIRYKNRLTTASIYSLMILAQPALSAEEQTPKNLFSLEQVQRNHPEISSASLQLANKIYDVMKPYLLDYDIDACGVGLDCLKVQVTNENTEKLILKLAKLIEERVPLEFNLLAFPFKSGNRDKNVIGHLADMAEYKSLEYLNSMMTKIEALYPNCQLTIYTDGLLFNDLFEIPNQTVLDYEQSLIKLALDFPKIKIITDVSMLDQKGLNVQEMRDQSDARVKADEQFANNIPLQKKELMKRRILNEINHSRHSFFYLSPHEQEQKLIELVSIVVGRGNTASTFAQQFASVRGFHLSIHMQKDFGKKLGIKLFDNAMVTPPNGVVVQDKDGKCYIKFKHHIDPKRYQLTSVSINDVSCPFYNWR